MRMSIVMAGAGPALAVSGFGGLGGAGVTSMHSVSPLAPLAGARPVDSSGGASAGSGCFVAG